MLGARYGRLRFRTYEDEGAVRNLIWQDRGLRAGEIGRAQEADAAVLHDLDGTVVPELDHSEVLLVGHFQLRKSVCLQPSLRGGDTDRVAGTGRHDLHAEAAIQPLAYAAHHQRDGRADVVHTLPRSRFGQGAIQIDPDPALLIGRTGGRGALGRSRLRRSLAKVNGGRLRSEEGGEPREHDPRVGEEGDGARIEVGGSAACSACHLHARSKPR